MRKLYAKVQDFLSLSRSLQDVYLGNIIARNSLTITAAAILTLAIEVIMTMRLFISHPAIDTPASRVYLVFYLSLIAVAGLYLILQPKTQGSQRNQYWLQFTFVACYLLWNVLLNSYDLYRNGRGSSLALVTALLFVSILIQLRPQHMVLLQSATFALFFAINHVRIEDKINASIAVCVAVMANLLFYARNIHDVDNQQRLKHMHAQLEKEQMDGAMQYLCRLQEAQTQTAIYHHDLRHTLHLVEQLALQGDLASLQSFVSQSQAQLDVPAPPLFCEHTTLNLILGSFHQRTAEKQILFETEIHLPAQLDLPDTELCALLSNLLENALHATDAVTDPTIRRIHVRMSVRDGKLVVVVENGFCGTVVMADDRPVPQTQNKYHGYGIQSIIDIAERHRGVYAFETQGHIFRAKILFHV